MLAQFQNLYPNGSIISELIEIFQGKYIVRVSIQLEGITRATGIAGAETVEVAEDQARNRALTVLGIKNLPEEVTKSALPLVAPPPIKPSLQESKPVPSVNNTEIYTPPFLEEKIDTQVTQPEYPPLSEVPPSNVTQFTPRSYTPYEDAGVQSAVGKKKRYNEPVNLSDVIAQTDVEIERLGWTPEQGKDYLVKTYSKRGRSLLSEEELRNFLTYLKSQPDPIAGFV
ncbi:hypothetical protein MEO40_25435 [Dolichospermum sp. ST_sed1]|nr:hypothetical protein [Dolichospermum sp. ST_sed1]MDD1428190.1 hypothetical protein [Dolichospermum sp. ST_sed9]MDD1434111.1 hypothetical protein [Dolichospermum sp. ST_sed6]MDD1443720.1 hypothetical protein [Dolichospermum sp. ST_sed3]MDD1449241.1 hypothetical protein [Dolichospermum sp. ST_sed8]MDD1458012.1 hypothetical protein [Dolichospermum sp. ST_sed7]MDD1463303.1 hypothetical protein [Dolichospermum sp. ST_sed2]MDD1468712.1 hypothetical protein [Dolichospermum sp. ST_sed5]MDD147453